MHFDILKNKRDGKYKLLSQEEIEIIKAKRETKAARRKLKGESRKSSLRAQQKQ